MRSSLLLPLALPLRRRWPARRGFSLVELMVVVIIIAVLAVAAIPQVTRRTKDRRTQQAAQIVANLYSSARMRAMGRGGSVLVRYTSQDQGSVRMIEAVEDPNQGGCSMQPVSSCTMPSWVENAADPGGVTTVLVDTFEPGPQSDGVPITISVTGAPPNAAQTQSYMDVCFSPLGRTFVRYASGAAWNTLAGVPVLSVQRTGSGGAAIGLIRDVLLLPNGAARLGVAR